jgi:hypothetical protein
MDSVDDELLRDIRRRVSLGTILRNIFQVRIRARQLGRQPVWSLSTGIYDRSIPGLVDLAWFAIEAHFANITFWNLVGGSSPNSDLPDRLVALADMPADQRGQAEALVLRVVHLLRSHGVNVNIPGDFVRGATPSFESKKIERCTPAAVGSNGNGSENSGGPVVTPDQDPKIKPQKD